MADSLATSVSGEDLIAYAVHHEATFDRDELRRHITVLALTATRLIVAHVDEHGAPDGSKEPSTASASTEAVRLEKVDSVVVTRVVPDPATYSPETDPIEVMLTIGWEPSVESTWNRRPAGTQVVRPTTDSPGPLRTTT